ncbi:SpoVR family protein [Alsobacter sp. SYSU M60028]|uniref:SpoVR family protein n=1 Tax=Alsobacter ponti TaxID=2962936 RepID=A0ABT1L6F6_9HYPH|nr:SpoVR family protein [Alsobacter ponti]MCP8936976.1 SpoVR family protein [Alsobacter ponti]
MILKLDPGERLLYRGPDWDFTTLRRIHDAIEQVALKDMGLDVYPNQIEVITAEQMLDAYSSSGMPLFYKHWSFGKHFAQHETVYRQGLGDLAYEIVINSNPCITYIMEENTATMQALVIAHASFGHNHFFKNNYLFKQWTDADGILDYLDFAKGFIAECEERYGHREVERVLDAAHSLMSNSVHRYPRRSRPDLRTEEKRERERREHEERMYNDLWRTVPAARDGAPSSALEEHRKALLQLPQENILYFLEKTAPRLKPWQREILRIVRLIAQYFYPQRQTKLMNEGCATWCHYRIMTALHERGEISDGDFMEAMHSHTNVTYQPSFDHPRYNGVNPYALGFAMMRDIARIAVEPTQEDREWFPDFAGKGDADGVLRDVWANYRDESFVMQFLSPRMIRDWRLFHLLDDTNEPALRVDAIHDERGYRRIRRAFAKQYDVACLDADIQVVDVDLAGDRRLILHHNVLNRVLLETEDTGRVMQHLADLWGYDVLLKEIDTTTGMVLKEHHAKPHPAG